MRLFNGNQALSRDGLLELYGMKVFTEFLRFKTEMLDNKPELIFSNAYQINCYIELYECLLQLGEELNSNELRHAISIKDLFDHVYEAWNLECKWDSNDLYGFCRMLMQKESKKKEVA